MDGLTGVIFTEEDRISGSPALKDFIGDQTGIALLTVDVLLFSSLIKTEIPHRNETDPPQTFWFL